MLRTRNSLMDLARNRNRQAANSGIVELSPQGGQGPQFDELSSTLMDEISQQEILQAQEFERRNAQIGAFGQQLSTGLEALADNSRRDAAGFAGLRSDVGSLLLDGLDEPNRVDVFMDAVNPVLDVGAQRQREAAGEIVEGLDRDGGRARKAARDAVQVQRDALSRFDRDYHSSVEAAVQGLESRAESFLQRAGSTRNPDGSLKSPAAMQAESRRAAMEVGQNAAVIKAEMSERWRGQRASLSANVSGALQALANVELNIAQLNTAAKAQTAAVEGEIAGRGQRAAEMRGQLAGADREDILRVKQAVATLQSNIFEVETSQRGAALTYAIEKVIEGNTTLYNMILQNPNSMVSKFTGLLAMANLAASQQAGAVTPNRPTPASRPTTVGESPSAQRPRGENQDRIDAARANQRRARADQDARNASPARRRREAIQSPEFMEQLGVIPRPF